jgi:hypothetical protein
VSGVADGAVLPPAAVATLVLLAMVAAVLLSRAIRRTDPGSVRARLLLALLPLGAVALAPAAAALIDATWATGLGRHQAIRWMSAHVWQRQDALRAALLVACSWLGTIFVGHAAAVPVGPATTLLSPAMVATMAKAGDTWESNRGWWAKALWFLAAALAGFLFDAIRGVEEQREQARRNADAAALRDRVLSAPGSGDVPEFSLYLRPFSTTGTIDAQVRSQGPLDLETLLDRALRPSSRLVALSRRSERFVVGSARLFLPDDEWRRGFEELASRARTVFVIPTAEGATVDEIEWLTAQRHLAKCVFVMPETVTGEGLQASLHAPSTVSVVEEHAADHAGDWARAKAALQARLGLRLPEYDERGALVRLDDGGAAIAVRPLGLASAVLKVAKLRDALQDPSISPR